MVIEAIETALNSMDPFYCQLSQILYSQKLEYYHIVLLAKGGSNTARNVKLLCEKCNRSKADKIE